MGEVPRVTRALRAFTDLGRKKKLTKPGDDILIRKRLEQAKALTQYLLPVNDILRRFVFSLKIVSRLQTT